MLALGFTIQNLITVIISVCAVVVSTVTLWSRQQFSSKKETDEKIQHAAQGLMQGQAVTTLSAKVDTLTSQVSELGSRVGGVEGKIDVVVAMLKKNGNGNGTH